MLQDHTAIISPENETLAYADIYARACMIRERYPTLGDLVDKTPVEEEALLEHILSYLDAEQWAVEQIGNQFFDAKPDVRGG